MIPIGAVLAGKYRVDRILGQGGMGVVVQATHLQLHQLVAVKFLLPEVMGHPQVVQRFLREAQAVVRLRSEHVARVLDVGSLETGAPYMVLEYLDGADLASYSRQQLTIGTIVDLMLQACEALAEAHALGIVHRDIKPANFFITRRADGALLLKVLDFGISKAAQSTLEGNLTATATVMGTPAYMSPEQMRSTRDVDSRSDIWSLGVVLYELLQGVAPFTAETFGSMAIKVATEPLPPLAVQLPPGLAEIVYRCLEKDPARRFQNVAELAQALAPYAQSTAQAAVSVERTHRVLRTEPPRALSTLSGATAVLTAKPRARRRAWIVAGALGLLGASSAIGIAALRGGAAEPGGAAIPGPPPPTTPGPSIAAPPPLPPPPVAATAAAPPPPPPAVPAPAPPVATASTADAVAPAAPVTDAAGAPTAPTVPTAAPPARASRRAAGRPSPRTTPPPRTAPPARSTSNDDDILGTRQ